jgi:hypothetical protein
LAKTISGNAIKEDSLELVIKETDDSKEINLSEISSEEIVVEFFTEGPISEEEEQENGKKIIISGPDELNYTDILAYTYLEDVEERKIRLLHEGHNVDFESFDENFDGLVDYIEWTVPHLSTQVYFLEIVIVDAEHLDQNKSFLENIYGFVNETDVFSYTIPDGDFVRAYFESELTEENYIDIFVIDSEDSKILVYEANSSEIIGEVEINNDGVYYISLNHSGSNSVFDMRSVGNVSYDFIHDEDPNVSL